MKHSTITKIALGTLFVAFLVLPLGIANPFALNLEGSHKSIKDIIIAAVGSAAGALGGFYMVESGQKRKGWVKEFRSINVALILATTTLSFLMDLRTRIERIRNQFYNDKAEFLLEYWNNPAYWPIGPVPAFNAKLDGIQPLAFPSHKMSALVFEEISVQGRPTLLMGALAQTLDEINQIIVDRNKAMEAIKAHVGTGPVMADLYFGFTTPAGNTDLLYSENTHNLYQSILRGLYQLQLICEDLEHHAEALRTRIGDSKLKICHPAFEAIDPSLRPNPEQFSSWANCVKGGNLQNAA